VDVALDLPVDALFTYAVPEALRLRAEVGRRVHVLFRGKRAVGFVASIQLKRNREQESNERIMYEPGFQTSL
jgi:primosomal protein N'